MGAATGGVYASDPVVLTYRGACTTRGKWQAEGSADLAFVGRTAVERSRLNMQGVT